MKDEYVDMKMGDEVLKGVHVDVVKAHEVIGWEVVVPEKPKQLSAEEKAAIKAAAETEKEAAKAKKKAATELEEGAGPGTLPAQEGGKKK